MTLPMRFRILHLLTLRELSEVELMEALRSEYGSEGQYKRSVIDTHLASMKAVGMIEITELSMGKDGNLAHKFKATDYGRNYLKYIPKGWSPDTPSTRIPM